jgi:hypothetical protein
MFCFVIKPFSSFLPTAADFNRLAYLGAAKLKKEMSLPGGHAGLQRHDKLFPGQL